MSRRTGEALAFPPGFTWGAATAAYQIEGATEADGRGPSVWDTFARTPGKVRGGDTGDIACDSYHRYPRGRRPAALARPVRLPLLDLLAANLPGGSGPAQPGRASTTTSALLDALDERGIAPAATLFHWDLPQALQDRGGWAARGHRVPVRRLRGGGGRAPRRPDQPLDHPERAAGGRAQRAPHRGARPRADRQRGRRRGHPPPAARARARHRRGARRRPRRPRSVSPST